MQFSLEFPEVLSQNPICYHWLSVSGNSKIMHCGILINTPYYLDAEFELLGNLYLIIPDFQNKIKFTLSSLSSYQLPPYILYDT